MTIVSSETRKEDLEVIVNARIEEGAWEVLGNLKNWKKWKIGKLFSNERNCSAFAFARGKLTSETNFVVSAAFCAPVVTVSQNDIAFFAARKFETDGIFVTF